MGTIRHTILAIAAALGVVSAPAIAETYPDRPITMIIPLGAGGSHDLNARVMTSVLPQILGQPVVVQLMPGAGGQIGTAAAASAPADGYTLLFTHNFIDELQQFVTTLPYSPNDDFVAVSRTNTAQPVLVVRNDSPFQTFDELIAYAQENPGQLRFGHSGNWGAFMVPGLALMQAAEADVTLIPYQGGGPVIQALLAGDVDFTFAFASVLAGQDLRPLLVVGDQPMLDGVPTTTELGYDQVSEIGVMNRVVLAPAGIPEDRLAILRDAFEQLNEDRTYLRLLDRLGENSDMMGGAEYNEVRLRQAEQYRALVESFGG
tara:strand:+ start:495 stop:1445 length:951 start_codon:yes stop_codon:yes gene_type:complete